MKTHVCLGLFLSVVCLSSHAQTRTYFPFFQQEYFFGHHPSPRTEARGRADVALGGQVSSLLYNPAGITSLSDWEVMASTSAPFYVLNASNYSFLGLSKQLLPKVRAALSLNRFSVGPSGFDVTIANQRYEVDEPVVNDLILTVAASPLAHLHVGVNAHLFSWKIFDDVSRARSLYLDIGAMYDLPLANNGKLKFGGSITNVSYSQIEFSSPTGETSSNVFPVIGRIGAAYVKRFTFLWPKGGGEQPVDVVLTTEVQDLFNSEFREAIKLGGEAIFAEFLVVRLGWYTRSEDDMGVATNLSRISDVTYGLGVQLPLNQITQGKLPVRVYLDYMSLENPPVVQSGPRRSNKRGFSIRVAAPLSSIENDSN